MSPAKLNVTLQEDFVKTELQNGHRMLQLAVQQRQRGEADAAADSLSMARLGLSGAEEHMAAISLPQDTAQAMKREASKLRRGIASFGGR